MRVLFIPSWFPTSSNLSAGHFIKQLAIDLSESNVQIEVLFFDYSYKHLSQKKSATEIINTNLKIHHMSGFHFPKMNANTQDKWVKTCINESKSLIENWDFDFIHSHDYVASFVGAKLSTDKNIKHIISLHHSNFIENKIKLWRIDLLQKVFHDAFKLITPSSKFTDKINSDFATNAITIPHYIHWELYLKEKSNNPLKAISVTSYESVKNNAGLINFCIENKVEIDIFGSTEKELLKDLPDHIKFKGKISFNELQKIYSSYDFLISFSHVETFGLTVLEAFSHGLPVLVKNKIGGLDLVNESNGMFIDNEFNYQNFINAISSFESEKIQENTKKTFNKKKIIDKSLIVWSFNFTKNDYTN